MDTQQGAKAPDNKGCLIFGFIIIAVAAIVGINQATKKDEAVTTPDYLTSTSSDSTALTTATKSPEQFLSDFKKDLDFKLYVVDTSMDRAKVRHSKGDILSEVDLFEKTALFLQTAPDSLNADLKNKLTRLKTKLIKIQKEDFPVLRKNYADWSAKQVWENNIDIQYYSSLDDQITFVATAFANRKNITAANETLIEVLKSLRFKRVSYKWFKSDDDYPTFSIPSKDDTEL